MIYLKTEIESISLISLNFYKIIMKPIYNFYSNFLASVIRNILFTYVPGYSVTEIKIDGVESEYDNILGVKEDVLNLILNIKGLIFKLKKKKKVIISLKNKLKSTVYGKDLVFNKDYVKLINPNHVIANLSNNFNFNLKLKVEKGVGYKEKSSFIKKDLNGIILDSYFCPIVRVSYLIEKFDSKKNDLDKIIFFIETNGSISVKNSLKFSIGFLIKHLSNFKFKKRKYKKKFKLDKNLLICVDDIDFKFRTIKIFNKLKIKYLGDLVQYSEEYLLKFPNLGLKTLNEIKNVLKKYNLFLGTKIKNWFKFLKKKNKNETFLKI